MTEFFRATVMLATLVGLPAAWVYYGPLPHGAQKVVDRFVDVARDTLGIKAPAAKSSGGWDQDKVAPRFDQSQFDQTQLDQTRQRDPTQGGPSTGRGMPQVTQAAAFTGQFADSPASPFAAPLATSGPAANPIALVSATSPTNGPSVSGTGISADGDLKQQLEPHFSLLQSLGAADYRLERWGSGGTLYRFHCAIALGSDNDFTREFDAVDADPVAAVRQVVGEATAWQNARLDNGRSLTQYR